MGLWQAGLFLKTFRKKERMFRKWKKFKIIPSRWVNKVGEAKRKSDVGGGQRTTRCSEGGVGLELKRRKITKL